MSDVNEVEEAVQGFAEPTVSEEETVEEATEEDEA